MSVNPFKKQLNKPVIFIILILLSGCATRDDFRQSFIARYVKDGEYTNSIKGFSLHWPDQEIWRFKNSPEFDLSFDHIDGRSQVLVIGVNKLIRRNFPEGFHQWFMDRLQARNVHQISRIENTEGDVKKFRIITECEFAIQRAQSLGVHRTTDALLMQRGKRWVAVLCICPVESYEQKKPLFDQIYAGLSML